MFCFNQISQLPIQHYKKWNVTLSIITLSTITLSLITLSIITLSIITLSIMGLTATFSNSQHKNTQYNNTQHNNTQHNGTQCRVFLCWVSFMLSVIYADCCWMSQSSPLCWVILCWMPFCWVNGYSNLGQSRNPYWKGSLNILDLLIKITRFVKTR